MSFFRRQLAFYTLGVGPLDADWLLQAAFGTLDWLERCSE